MTLRFHLHAETFSRNQFEKGSVSCKLYSNWQILTKHHFCWHLIKFATQLSEILAHLQTARLTKVSIQAIHAD